jgi:hypothetical protein
MKHALESVPHNNLLVRCKKCNEYFFSNYKLFCKTKWYFKRNKKSEKAYNEEHKGQFGLYDEPVIVKNNAYMFNTFTHKKLRQFPCAVAFADIIVREIIE